MRAPQQTGKPIKSQHYTIAATAFIFWPWSVKSAASEACLTRDRRTAVMICRALNQAVRR